MKCYKAKSHAGEMLAGNPDKSHYVWKKSSLEDVQWVYSQPQHFSD